MSMEFHQHILRCYYDEIPVKFLQNNSGKFGKNTIKIVKISGKFCLNIKIHTALLLHPFYMIVLF